MALNKLMHPRNPYKDKKPDFKALALKYEEFRKHTTQDSKEHVHIDFKKPECMRALSWALLKEDFGLDVEMPLNRLIPTVPLRLNYILWIEDLLAQRRDGVKGIDIVNWLHYGRVVTNQSADEDRETRSKYLGVRASFLRGTGASCVYPLLAAKKNSWKFLATETDDFNTEYARRNVERNGLQHAVQVLQVSPHTKLCGAVSDGDRYDFCMCNPPFFGSNLEAWGMLTSRSDDRPEPKSVSTASPQESIVTGGEVEFVKQIILDSLELKNKIRIYTTMLGKKSSLAPLKAELHKHRISKFGTTELCQGRTMRWALGWTFEDDVVFKPPISKLSLQKLRPPLLLKLPCQCGENDNKGKSGVEDMNDRIVQLLNQLQMTYKVLGDPAATTRKWQVTAKHNTWSHQRRKRRQMAQLASKEKLLKPDSTNKHDDSAVCKDGLGQQVDHCGVTNGVTIHEEGQTDTRTGDSRSCGLEDRLVTELLGNGDISTGEDINGSVTPHRGGPDDVGGTEKGGEIKDVGHRERGGDREHLLRYTLGVTRQKDNLVLQFTWVDGRSFDLLHQVVQFFRNRLQ